jgi:hypothetical protein
MSHYTVIERCTAYRCYTVEASSPEEAKAKVESEHDHALDRQAGETIELGDDYVVECVADEAGNTVWDSGAWVAEAIEIWKDLTHDLSGPAFSDATKEPG